MQFAIEHGPAFTWLKVLLAPGERIQAEAGTMVQHSPGLEMDTRPNAGRRGGFFSTLWSLLVALCRRLLGAKALFVNEFHGRSGGEVVLAPRLSGTILHRSLTGGSKLFVQRGSYLASTGNIDTKLRWEGLKTFFGGEGLILLECSGDGDLFAHSYGGTVPIEVDGTFIVDTGHIVAFDGSLDFRVRGLGGIKSFLFSGEGLVCEFSGKGMLYMQFRNLDALANWLGPILPR
jgi:uncharacterized protein (TIGR00266 family)